MATPDAHTPCPFCHITVRTLMEEALQVRFSPGRLEGAAPELLARFVAAVDDAWPLFEAHYANQAHAFSRELAGARGDTGA
jgi:hypothetical protein